uniref:Uncharacterized protein n=1 Tax=Arundo donax TaxID=35708 RepID=A0A0A9EU56_ARUDO
MTHDPTTGMFFQEGSTIFFVLSLAWQEAEGASLQTDFL